MIALISRRFKMKRIPILLVFLTTVIFTSAAEPNSWHGLVLDVSTADDITNELGKPNKIKTKQKFRSQLLGDAVKNLRFRTFEYKNKFGVDSVKLYLHTDVQTNKESLRVIRIDLKEKLDPNILPDTYGVDFGLTASGMDVANTKRGRLPDMYYLYAMPQEAYIEAFVNRVSGFGGVFSSLGGLPDTGPRLPGKVEYVTLISRTFDREDEKEASVLE
jgi:hypothetical protein